MDTYIVRIYRLEKEIKNSGNFMGVVEAPEDNKKIYFNRIEQVIDILSDFNDFHERSCFHDMDSR